MRLILRFAIILTEIAVALSFTGIMHRLDVTWDVRALMLIASAIMCAASVLSVQEAAREARLFNFDGPLIKR